MTFLIFVKIGSMQANYCCQNIHLNFFFPLVEVFYFSEPTFEFDEKWFYKCLFCDLFRAAILKKVSITEHFM